jgi:FAD/FMN-containing dehydrogenase
MGAWQPAHSAFAIVAHSSADVAAGVDFARHHRLRVVVKGGGHSYQGTSNAADSLLIWMRPMHAIKVHERFVPRDCEGRVAAMPAVEIEAGAVWMDVYDAVTTRAGRYVQGGGCATVGVAGLVQSGGFGSFSKMYGTSSSHLLQAEIVTADGRLRTVNACRDPELFWALKGGGGGSFGVVTRLVLRTHALPRFFGGAAGTIEASSDADFRRLVRNFVDLYADKLCNPNWGESVKIRSDNKLQISMVCAGLEDEEATRTWQPFFDWVAASPDNYKVIEAGGASSRIPARLWWDADARRQSGTKALLFDDRPGASSAHAWWRGDQDQVGAFIHGFDSIWLPASLLDPGQRDRLADALFAASRHVSVELQFNKGLAGAADSALAPARATAMNPAALDAFALAIVATGGPPRYAGLPGAHIDDARARSDANAVDQAMRFLAAIAPARGSYVSESNYFNREWARAFWGTHYRRLKAAKDRYDPEGFFFVHHGVGSERWNADGFDRLT